MAMVGYCHVCGTRIPKDDFERGRAVEVEGKAYCAAHAESAPRPASGGRGSRGPVSSPSRRIANRVSTSRRHPATSSRRTSARRTTGVVVADDAEAARRSGTARTVWTALVVILVGGGAIAAVLAGGFLDPSSPSSSSPDDDGGPVVNTDSSGTDADDTPDEPAVDLSAWRTRVQDMQSALLEFRASRTGDPDQRLAAARSRWEQLASATREAPLEVLDDVELLHRAWGHEVADLMVAPIEAELEQLATSKQVPEAADLARRVVAGDEPDRLPPGLLREADMPPLDRLRGRARSLSELEKRWLATDTAVEEAEELRKKGQFGEALARYNRVLQQFPGRYDALTYAAFCKRQLGNAREALSDLHRAVEQAPHWPNAWFQRGFTYQVLREWQRAADDYTKVLDFNDRIPNAWENRGLCRFNMKQDDEAIRDLKRGIAMDPDDDSTHYILGRAYLRQDNQEAALAEFNETIRLKPTNARARYYRGRLLVQLDRPAEAVLDLQICVREDADDWAAWFYLGRALAEQPEPDVGKALEALRQSHETCPDADNKARIAGMIRRLEGE